MNKPLKITLAASLALNVFFIAALGAMAYRWTHMDHPLAQRGLRLAAEQLTPERQAEFRTMLRETRRDARPLIAASRERRREVLDLLAAPEFDSQAVNTALASTRQADAQLRMRLEERMVQFAEKLSPDERAKLAEGLIRRGPLRGAAPEKE